MTECGEFQGEGEGEREATLPPKTTAPFKSRPVAYLIQASLVPSASLPSTFSLAVTTKVVFYTRKKEKTEGYS